MGRESLFHFYSRYVRIIYVQCKTIHKQTPIASSKYELIYCDAKVLFLLFIGESNKFTSFICWPFYCRNVKLVNFLSSPKNQPISRLGSALDSLDSEILVVYVCELILKSYVFRTDHFHDVLKNL